MGEADIDPGKRAHERLLDAGCLAALLALALYMLGALVASRGWPQAHDGYRYAILLEHFRDAAEHGCAYPRWLADFAGGYGYPEFVFYPSGVFFAALPATYLAGSILEGLRWTVVAALVAGAWGVFLLGKTVAGRLGGLFAGALFLLAPYHYVNVYVRGDLVEFFAICLLPWPFYFLLRVRDAVKAQRFAGWGMLGVAASLAAVVYSHPATAMLGTGAFCALAAYLALDQEKGRRLAYAGRVSAAVALAIAWSLPYWWPVMRMLPLTQLDVRVPDYYTPKHHFVEFGQLFSRSWDFGTSVPGPDDKMSFALGLPHLLYAVGGLVLCGRQRVMRGAAVLYLFLILLMLPFTAFVWEHVGLLQRVQFPWRLLGLAALLQALCAAGIANLPQKRWRAPVLGGLLVAAFLLLPPMRTAPAFYPAGQAPEVLARVHPRGAIRDVFTFDEGEWLPATVRELPKAGRGDALVRVNAEEGAVTELEGHSPYRIRVRVEGPAGGCTVALQQFYFPGWHVSVDGARVDDSALAANLTPQGTMQLALADGAAHEIEAWYDGPPGWRARAALALLSAVGFAGWLFHERRRLSRQARTA